MKRQAHKTQKLAKRCQNRRPMMALVEKAGVAVGRPGIVTKEPAKGAPAEGVN